MSLALNKITIASANANSAGAYFLTKTFTVSGTGSTVVTAGTYLVQATANVTTEIQTASTGNTWGTLLANGAGGMIISDGTNVRFTGTTSGNKTVTTLTVNPSTNATGQYNT